MAVPQPNARLSEAEYLAIERVAETKSEFYDGEVFAMARATGKHNLIANNLNREVGNRLEGRPCVVFNSDMRLKVEATGLFTYPDLSVVCGQVKYAIGPKDTLLNPILVAEVLSDSTEAYDRGKKSEHYRQIPSLREYLLASQDEPYLELFSRLEDRWVLREVSGLDAKIEVPALQITLALSKTYANLDLLEGA